MNQKEIECTGLIALGCIAGLILLLIVGGIVTFSLGWGGNGESLEFYQVETVPEDAVIIKLTEDDYEKYPILRDIPNGAYLDTSPISQLFEIKGLIDRETGLEIQEAYGSQIGEEDRYVEHNGLIYEVCISVS